jgi:hypothetical protein
MGNGSGSYRTTPANAMAAYDKLPKAVRQVLAGAYFQWAPQPWRTAWNRGDFGNDSRRLAAHIERLDRDTMRAEVLKVWGPDYPGARPAAAKRRKRQP